MHADRHAAGMINYPVFTDPGMDRISRLEGWKHFSACQLLLLATGM
jgi:hypothetical protein